MGIRFVVIWKFHYKTSYSKRIRMAANRGMESRIRDLESEFDMESRRSADMEKNLRKAERQIKELNCLETDRHIEGQRMEKMITQLTAEMEGLQARLDEAHQIGPLNLANYRKAQQALEEVEARASIQEEELAKTKIHSRNFN